MAFHDLSSPAEHDALADINMVPLIDVMLVLLIVFIVAAPLLTHAVRLDLPRASSQPLPPPSPTEVGVQLSLDAAGQAHWNRDPIDAVQLRERLVAAGRQSGAALVLHLHADRATPYERVAQVLSEASQAGVHRIGFVTDPAPAPAPANPSLRP